jgi:hypothetical protein
LKPGLQPGTPWNLNFSVGNKNTFPFFLREGAIILKRISSKVL